MSGPARQEATFYVRVIPRAQRDELVGGEGELYKIRLKAPPVEGRANDALVRFLAARLDIPRAQIEIVRGATSRNKLVRVTGLDLQAVRAKLGA